MTGDRHAPDEAAIVNVEVAVVRGGEVLLITRGAGEEHAPGVLSLPGGKLAHAGRRVDRVRRLARQDGDLGDVGRLRPG